MAKNKIKILVIDDDPKVSWILSEGLSKKFEFVSARDGIEGIQMVTTEKPDLVLLDIKMPGMNGMEVLEKLNKLENRPEIIMVSGHGETQYVVDSVKLGAAEFINKPFDVNEIEIHINTILEKTELKKEVKELKSKLEVKSTYDTFIGDSTAMQKVKSVIEQVSDSELTVLIRGESGTGKEIVARLLHSMSGRRNEEFVKVNCAAIPRDLLEAELFGYEKGAFTGAHKMKQGRFEIANKGTMFLDEIGDMPLELQSKLLQVLEQQEFVRVGGVQNIHVDVRIIGATNKNLEQGITNKEFREDLFYRLNEITLLLPSLRVRKEDIVLLVNHFKEKYEEAYKKNLAPISQRVMSQLLAYDWPGNVRQLENMMKQVVVREDESIIAELLAATNSYEAPQNDEPAVSTFSIPQVTEKSNSDPDSYSLKTIIGEKIAVEEKKLISEVLQKTNWNRRKAAELLDISYRSLLYKIKDYSLNSTK